MPTEINGLPLHVLLVHAVVVLVPLSAALLVGAALREGIRLRLGAVLPALAGLCVVLVPLTTSSGDHLKLRVESGPLVARHAELGDRLLPWTLAVLVLSLVVHRQGRRARLPAAPAHRPVGTQGTMSTRPLVRLAVAVLSVLVAAGTVVQVVRIGDSGARAVWEGIPDAPP